MILGIMGRTPVAGVAWQALHYLEGFRRLGCDIFYVEDTGHWPYDAEQNTIASTATIIAPARRRARLRSASSPPRQSSRGCWMMRAYSHPISWLTAQGSFCPLKKRRSAGFALLRGYKSRNGETHVGAG